MGICSSVDSTLVATAKLIMPDGRLQEYSQPIKVQYVLQRLKTHSYFICNADELDFDVVVSPLNDEEELQLGQLYFILSINLLKYPLKTADMAELAVRASNALTKSCGNGVDNKWLSLESVGNGRKVERSRRSQSVDSGGRRRRRRTYSTDLGVIIE